MKNELIMNSLKETMNSYYPLSDNTWEELKKICTIKKIKKSAYSFDFNQKINAISYVYEGLFRIFAINENGEELNKNFFWERRIYGDMIALLSKNDTKTAIQALEDSIVIDIIHDKYRELLYKYDDLKMYHILYLEKHWIFQKDNNTYSLVLEDALKRYMRFLKEFGHIEKRLSQYHVALYLGITPTHLSRIKKELSKDNYLFNS